MKTELKFGSLYVTGIPCNGIAQNGISESLAYVDSLCSQLYNAVNDAVQKAENENPTMNYSNVMKLPEVQAIRKIEMETRCIYSSLSTIRDYFDLSENDSDDNQDKMWDKWQTKSGTWVKRFSKYVYRNYEEYDDERKPLKVPAEILGRLGEIIRRNSISDNKDYFYEISHFCDWTPGNFAEKPSSCWWQEYSAYRTGLIDAGGFAVLFYESKESFDCESRERGIGRCWGWMDEETKNIYLFNAYGISLLNIARVLSTQFGLVYKKVEFDYVGSYVNGNDAFCLSDGPTSLDSYVLDLDIEEYSTCHRCDNRIYDRDGMTGTDEELYCRECFNELFTSCDCCGRITDRDDITTVESGDEICDCCLNRYYVACTNCGDHYSEREVYYVDGDAYCDNCHDMLCDTCDRCGVDFLKSELIDSLKSELIDYMCESCYEKSSRKESEHENQN